MEFYRLNKKLCPICRSSIEYHAYVKVENLAICNACDKKIYMDEEKRLKLTLDDLEEHIQYREKNEQLLECLDITKSASMKCGFLGMADICVDETRKLWYVDAKKNPPVFPFGTLEEFVFRADDTIITRIVRDGISEEPDFLEATLSFPWEEFTIELRIEDPYVTKLNFRMAAPEMTEANIAELIRAYEEVIQIIKILL